jgi:phosphoserine phosphatase RsbX
LADDPEPAYEWAVAQRALPGEAESGDLALVAARTEGTLIAVLDGLGHGEEAAVAARRAVRTLEAHVDEDLAQMVRRCHEALKETRGAVMALGIASEDGTLTWTGVGNVEAVVVRDQGSGNRAREHALLLGGILGMQIPAVRPSRIQLTPGDEVIFATDGIRRSFIDDLVVGDPQLIADDIMRRYATNRDDALVLVGRYRRAPS